MKLIELHLIQSFSATCLNRDDVGAPKSILFGGVNRARVSSQCWKRTIRELAAENAPESFAGKRGHYHIQTLQNKLIELGVDEESAKALATETISKYDGKGKKDNKGNEDDKEKKDSKRKKDEQTSVALYFTPHEIDTIASELKAIHDKSKDSRNKKGNINIDTKIIKSTPCHDFADIAIFGRMVAADHSLMLEGAGMFSHAISTHAVTNEIDFFSAIDDTKPLDNAGAGHIGTLELNSACYYRYIGLNVDLLFDEAHLGRLDTPERKAILTTFLKAVIEAVPGARKNSMFGFTRPQFVMGLVRKGQPLSLVNAFETPIQTEKTGGYIVPSIKKLEEHWKSLKEEYALAPSVLCEAEIGQQLPIDTWLDQIINSAMEE